MKLSTFRVKINIHLDSWQFWMLPIFILALLALLLNLGLNPFIEDEAIRATVAMEMLYSDNYIIPTFNGEYYYYKPPLYNWILCGFYFIFSEISEWTSRFPTVFFLLGFCGLIYKVNMSNGFSRRNALIVSLIYLTCGRILFWDSFLGLIDIFFSMVIYLMIYLIYKYINDAKYMKMYMISYSLASVGFLLKGYPALAFLGITIIVGLFLKRSLKKIFHPYHILGIISMVIFLGSYYYLYSQYNDVGNTITPLLSQATIRTVIKYNYLDAIIHIVTYPFENVYHFLPWSLMAILLFRKDFMSILRNNSFVVFSFWAFVFNIIIYWVSPEVYPRYILMLMPLIFTVFVHFYVHEIKNPTWRLKLLSYLFKGLVILVPVILLISICNEQLDFISYKNVKGGILFILLCLLAWSYFKFQNSRIFIFVAVVLTIRIAFNLLVLPVRSHNDTAAIAKVQAISVAEKYGNEGISLYKKSVFDFTSTFYIQKKLGYILERKKETKYEIIDLEKYALPQGYSVVDSILIRRNEKILKIISR